MLSASARTCIVCMLCISSQPRKTAQMVPGFIFYTFLGNWCVYCGVSLLGAILCIAHAGHLGSQTRAPAPPQAQESLRLSLLRWTKRICLVYRLTTARCCAKNSLQMVCKAQDTAVVFAAFAQMYAFLTVSCRMCRRTPTTFGFQMGRCM